MTDTPSLFRPSSLLLVAALSFCGAGFASADTVTLKNGTKIEGRITFEAADMIRVEVKVTDTIKETKTIAKADIVEVVKTKPDLIAFAELEKKLPIPSLMNAEQYRTFISSGPEKFLRDFPGSEKKADVEKILATLNEELDKAERGFVKVGDTWYSPEDREAHPAIVESSILHFGMTQKAKAGQHLAALRDFEQLEEKYYGTPAYAAAVPQAIEVVMSLGRQFTAHLADVDYRKQQYENGLTAMNELDRANTLAARQAEADAHKKQLDEERKAGIRWPAIDIRERSELEAYVKNLQIELARLQSFDAEGLSKLATTLKAADDLIAQDKLAEAKLKLSEAKGVDVRKAVASTGTDPKKKAPAKSNVKFASSYEKSLSTLLSAKEKSATLQQKAAAEAAKVANVVKGSEATSEPGAPADGTAAPAGDNAADLSDLLATKSEKTPAAEDKKKTAPASKKTTKKATPSKASSGDDEEEGSVKKKPVVSDDDSGGGISFTMIMIIVTVLLGLTVGALKFMGIGGAKKE